MRTFLFLILMQGLQVFAYENVIASRDLYVLPTVYCDTNEVYAREVFIEVATQLSQSTRLVSCVCVEDSAMLKYHLTYLSNPPTPSLKENCPSDYIVVISFKNRNKIEHRDGFVMELGFFVPDVGAILQKQLTGSFAIGPVVKDHKSVIVSHHREGWKYFYTTTITCTFYDSKDGRRVFVASETVSDLIKSRKDDLGNSDHYAAAYLGNIKKLARILRSKCESRKAWKAYAELINNATLD